MPEGRRPPWETGEPGAPAVPGQEGTCPPHDDWTEAEKWAWGEIRSGRPANFHAKCGGLDPKNAKAWNSAEVRAQRLLRPEFLRAILLNQPWRGALSHTRVVIFGAYFAKDICLQGGELPFGIKFSDCRFEGGVRLDGAIVPQNLKFNNCAIRGDFDIEMARVRGSVLLEKSMLRGGVKAGGAVV